MILYCLSSRGKKYDVCNLLSQIFQGGKNGSRRKIRRKAVRITRGQRILGTVLSNMYFKIFPLTLVVFPYVLLKFRGLIFHVTWETEEEIFFFLGYTEQHGSVLARVVGSIKEVTSRGLDIAVQRKVRGEDLKRFAEHGSISGTLRKLNARKLEKRQHFLYLRIMRAQTISDGS